MRILIKAYADCEQAQKREAEGDDVLERRPVDDVEPKCRRVGNVSAAVCPQRPPRTRRGTRGGRSKTKWPLTKLTLCPPT